MATKHIIARGIGFSPAGIKFIVTHGFAIGETQLDITDTDIIQLPVDYWLAKDVPFTERWRTVERFGGKSKTRKLASAARPMRLQGDGPSFTVKTSRRGFD